jgi:hypothetical protein
MAAAQGRLATPEALIPVLMYGAVTPVSGRERRLGLALGLLAEYFSAIREAGFRLLGITEALAAAAVASP